MREQKYIAVNITTDDGMTNGASNIIRKIQLHDRNRPSGIIWVQFDHTDVGQKARHNNRCLYVKGIEYTWTPIKPNSLSNLLLHNLQLEKIEQLKL